MKTWPEDGSPVNIEELIEPTVKAIRFAYAMQRKNQTKSIPWSGPDITDNAVGNTFTAKQRFTVKSLQYNEDEQDRDSLNVILGLAFQLGIEQGRRIYKTSAEYKTLELKLQMAKLGHNIE